jgi:hypothetical protein
MNCLRHLTLAALTAVALALPIAGPLADRANAQQTHAQHGHQRVYWVYYRSSSHAAWVCYGGYYQENQAVQAVNYYRYYGHDAYYR